MLSGARKTAVNGGIFGGVLSLVQLVWALVGHWQQFQQMTGDWPWLFRWLGSPLAGPSVAIVAMIALYGIVSSESRTKSAGTSVQTTNSHGQQVVVADSPGTNVTVLGTAAMDRTHLTGKAFHTFKPDGDFQGQGVVRRVDGGGVFVTMFSWVDGSPNGERYLTEAEYANAHFYDSTSQMRDVWISRQPDPEWARKTDDFMARVLADDQDDD